MQKKFYYPVIFEPEDTGFSVYVPDLPGCFTQGDTLEEALQMVQEAIGLMLDDKFPSEYPSPSNPQDIALEGKNFMMIVEFDKLAYDRKYNSKSIKKTLSIPAWLDNMAKKKNINFSNVLQKALYKELQIE